MDTQKNSERALKSAQEQEDQRQCRNKRDRACCTFSERFLAYCSAQSLMFC